MIKKALVAAAIALIASPSFVSAQEFFFSFDDASLVTSSTADAGTSASAFLFADSALDINSFNLEFSTSDSDVLAISGGEVFNPTTIIGQRFDVDPPFNFNADTGTADIFPVAILGTGINPGFTTFDDLFVDGVGTLIARVDLDLVAGAGGEATLDIGLGGASVPSIDLPANLPVALTFGSASLTSVGDVVVIPTVIPTPPPVEPTPPPVVPEPSSAILLILGAVGAVARRRRS